MPARVVQVLEVVQVDEQQRAVLSGAQAALKRVAKPVAEQAAVGQAGQGVEEGQPLRGGFGQLAFGHVGKAAHHAQGPALRVALDDIAPVQRPEGAAVLAPHAVLVPVGAQPLRAALDRGMHGRTVLVEQAQVEVGVSRAQVAGLVPEQFEPACVVLHLAGLQVPVPQALAGDVQDIAQSTLALLDHLLRATDVADVLGDDEDARQAALVDEGLLDRLEVVGLPRAVVGGLLEDDLGLAARHDGQHVLAEELGLLRGGAEVPVVLAHHLVGRGAVEVGYRTVAEQEVAFMVLEDDEIGALVEHGAQQGAGLPLGYSGRGSGSRSSCGFAHGLVVE